MMSLWDALRMNMMISYQELVRTFPRRESGINLPVVHYLASPKRSMSTHFHFRVTVHYLQSLVHRAFTHGF
ncbi:hypothetical protein E2112_27710 [Escherichia coli]|nr:hypothetical protein E2112_27710 [Escherichia coli]